MSSCASHRLAEVAVGLAIVLLLALLLVLWTGNTGISIAERKIGGNESVKHEAAVGQVVFNRDLLQVTERSEIQIPHSAVRSTVTEDPNNGRHSPSGQVGAEDPTWGHWKGDILPSGGSGDSEHIILTKANQNTYEDPIDELSQAARHHSGHFRLSQSRVWDPHPQYEFTAFGRSFHLSLREDSSFVPSGVTVTHIGGNTSRREYPDQHLGCFYSGHVMGDPKSVVSVSLCHGMTGHMRTSTGNYLIKPTERWPDNENSAALVGSPLQHVIYRLSKSDFSGGGGGSSFSAETNRTANDLPDDNNNHNDAVGTACGVTDNKKDSEEKSTEEPISRRRRRRAPVYLPEQDDSYDEDGGRSFALESNGGLSDQVWDLDIYGSWRTRRALPREYFIEVMVVTDTMMIDYHGASLTSYILVLMNTVSRIYKDPSIGNPISIVVVKIKQVDQIFGVKPKGSNGISAADMLKKFCYWQTFNNPNEPSPEHHDLALLLTRENLCSSSVSCDTLGLAELGNMCTLGWSCAIVQDNGLATAFTIAHEIGHVLNMPHDDDAKCNKYGDRSGVHKIMSRMLDDNTVPWEWSKCSRHYVTEFFDAGKGNCLLDEPWDNKMMTRSHRSRLPGEDYSENKQCELVYGQNSTICPHMVSDVPKWGGDQCHTQHMPWADGTRCGEDKWCHRGECVSKENLEPVDGQWGEWSAYGNCSRSCGGGIKKKYRECNRPSPKNGGNYCVGERVRYRSCGTRECPPGSTDFREEQCAAFNNNNLNIRNLEKNVKWHAKDMRKQPDERCKLYCEVKGNQYYMLRDKVLDGTPCAPDTFHICVNGLCQPAGCDHMLNSTATLDTCGVCRGDNSTCERIWGSHNYSEFGYTRVTEIPAGSSNIDIRQLSWKGYHNDSTYLALRLKKSGEYILNGNLTVMTRKVIIQPGVTIEYSGPDRIVERLNSTRPIHVDLILEVLSVEKVYPPQISYEFTVPKKKLNGYTWSLTDWTPCDRMCQGKAYRQALCRNAESKNIMPEDYCPLEERPREESRSCNEHCELHWQEVPSSKSDCSSHCGPGTRLVKYRCVQQLLLDGSSRPVPSHVCNHLKRLQERRSCIGPCEYARWQYGDWTACSVTCGDNGFQYRTALCVDEDNRTLSEDKCPAHRKITRQACGNKPCPKWGFGDWNPCSASCGIGKRERPYWCLIDNRVVNPKLCNGLPAGITEICDAGPCPDWHAGEWSTCSASCGDGIRRRIVVCEYPNGTMSRDCETTKRPISTISCALEPCPTKASLIPVTYSSNLPVDDLAHENDVDSHRITFRSGYKWHVEGFEECSKSCGGGIAKQIIRCVSSITKKDAPNEDYCDLKKRPQDKVVCNEHQCPSWTTGGWDQCDVTCGVGYQHRQVLCQDLRGEIMNDSDCSEKTRPRHERNCQRAPCPSNNNSDNAQGLETYKWRTGPWGDCSASCGNGVRRRAVNCHRVNSFGWQDPSPSHGCAPSEKPASVQSCKTRNCSDQFYWTASSWRKCSHPCGRKGRQLRRVFCLDRQGRKVRRRHCQAGLKPPRKRKCNQRPCTGPTSCAEVQTRLKTYTDGDYTLLVGGRYMTIYCHGMQSYEPLEYLTLPTGEQENYAEIYDKRLRDPHTCPHDGRRNDSCECMVQPATISGRTVFKKLRINVHTLHIIPDDFRFSTTIGQNSIEYGKAGDCYSQINCPQGRFGINLSKTLLMLSPDVHWPKQQNSYSLINKINNQRVIGKCGGYCGFCTPAPGLKLNVLPP